jgi:pimeloyl-ACP methyl ester carboxylesterase
MPAACGNGGKQCLEKFILPGGWEFPVYRNVPLSGSPDITHAVIVIHGILRNANSYFAGMMAAATNNHVEAHTIVVAPWFQTAQDEPDERGPYWIDQPPRRADAPGWMQGDAAVRPAGLSSFTVVDDLLATLADPRRFPNLRSITVAGHSAGGQFVQRYAVFALMPDRLTRVSVNYVAANPSSFVYFDPSRPIGDGTRFAVPTATNCPGYDTYKYGFGGRTGYVAALSPIQAFNQYLHRRVTIVNGAADTFDNGDEDTTCAAMAQGPHRAARGANYLAYIRTQQPAAPHDRIVVPNVGHSQGAIFGSPLVGPVLFAR